jgi:hypothetical protein
MSSGAVSDLHPQFETRAGDRLSVVSRLRLAVPPRTRLPSKRPPYHRIARTTRERGETANAAGISLCTKTIVGRPVGSAAIGVTIRMPPNANIAATSDT